MRKVTILKDIENQIQTITNYQTNIDYTKPKFMATFPYPYMNGKLHLGHAFTMLKVDFECRWKQINGYNVFFPFGFHCTGMPICAAAKKLEKEIENGTTSNEKSQYQIMKSSGISEEHIPHFIDPNYWVKFFPALGIQHLKKLGVMADTSKSFITTELNPFYDSFVKWQFNKLYQKGYLKYGTRNSIYSIPLDIQCQDHDRSKGEGIQVDKFSIIEFCLNDGSYLWVPLVNSYDNQQFSIKSINIQTDQQYNLVIFESGKRVYMSDYVHQNYVIQDLSKEKISISKSGKKVPENGGEIFNLVKKYQSEYSKYLGGEIILNKDESSIDFNNVGYIELPSDVVVDRMDSVCVVKPIPQWYIDYSNDEWKMMAHQCLNQMKLSDGVKNGLSNTINWIKEWGVSRPFGLGTRLPMDPNYLIYSLSDSTIYPAYYTIANQLHSDIYGHVSKFDPNDFTEQVWDYIFTNKPLHTPTPISMFDLNNMKQAFEYYYPVDIRISGKDLMTNHLAMYIFNHVAIFDKKHWPVSINCNGWVLVNGEKMSKSKGNFITIESGTLDNSVDAVRLTLADSGDNMDDANYITTNAGEHSTLKLFSWMENIEKIYSKDIPDVPKSPLDFIFTNVFNNQIAKVKDHYSNYRYKMVIRDGFHEFNNLREKYRIYCKYLNQPTNQTLQNQMIEIQLMLLYPVIPHLTSYLWSKLVDTGKISDYNINKYITDFDSTYIDKFGYIEDTVNSIRERVDRYKKKNKIVNQVKITLPKLDILTDTLIKAQFKFTVDINYDDTSKGLNIQIN
jgi:leucyl-tRNA synthetase